MKGPGLRIRMDVRRTWRCPRCGHVVKLPGQVVAQRCTCAEQAWMVLDEPLRKVQRPVYAYPAPRPEVVETDETTESEDSVPRATPSQPVESGKPATAGEPTAPNQITASGESTATNNPAAPAEPAASSDGNAAELPPAAESPAAPDSPAH